jgi:hypothetical protein
MQRAVDLGEDLIHVPGVPWPWPSLAQLARELGSEPQNPTPDALMRDGDAALGEDQLDVAQAEAEEVVEPYGMPDDLGREAVAGVGGGL